MHKSKLIQIMSTLSASEMARFDKYVHSPFFTVHQDTILLFEVIKEAYPDFEEDSISAESIYAKIYPNISYNDARLRTLRKYLLKLLTGFLSYLETEKDEWHEQRTQLIALFNRGLDKYVAKQLEESEKALTKQYKQSLESYLHQFRLLNLKVEYQNIYEDRFEPKDQAKALETLDYFYLVGKLIHFNSLLGDRHHLNQEMSQMPIFEMVMAMCKEHLTQLPFIIQAYYHSISVNYLEEAEASSHYIKLKELCPEIFLKLTASDAENICNNVINYCIKQYQSGDNHYLREMYYIYKMMLENNLLFNGAMLSSHHYKNITTIGLRLREFAWTEKFIEDYKDEIELQYRDGVYNYNLAHLYAYKKEYSKAMKCLQDVEFLDPFYKMSYDLLLLKIYYECNEIEGFMSLCSSFQIFIKRKKNLQTPIKNAYLNFIKSTKALLNIKVNNKQNLQKVKRSIEESESLTEKSWLLEKIAELEEVKV